VARNAFVLLSRYAVLWGLNAVLVLFLPRYLGDAGLGRLYFALSFVGLFQIGVALGTRHYVIKEVARDNAQLAAFLGPALALRTLSGLTVLAVIAGAAMATPQSRDLFSLVFVAALWMIATAFSQLMAAFIIGRENMTWPAMAEVVEKVVVVTAGILVLVNGLGAMAYAAVLLLGAVVDAAINAVYVARFAPIRPSFRLPKLKSLFIGGMPFLMMGFLSSLYHHVDMVMLRYFTNEAVVGWYAAANQIYRAVEYLPIALTTALLPTLSRVHKDNAGALLDIAQKGIRAGVIAIVPIAVAVSLLSGPVIRTLPYPDAFSNSVPLLTVLALTMPVTSLLTILGTIAMAVDRQNAWAVALGGTVLLNAALNAVAIPIFHSLYGNGGLGTALATLLSECFMVIIGIRLMPKSVIDSRITGMFMKTTLAGAAMGAAGLLLTRAGAGPAPAVGTALAVYVALIAITRTITSDDLLFLREALLKRLTGRKKGRRAQTGEALP
jgi:O-antigen/teichoic acid export membrane protein